MKRKLRENPPHAAAILKRKRKKMRKIAEIQLIVRDTDGFVVAHRVPVTGNSPHQKFGQAIGQLVFDQHIASWH